MANLAIMLPLAYASDVCPARDFPPEPFAEALRRARLASNRGVFAARKAGDPCRHLATWTGRRFEVGRDATEAERWVIAAVGTEPAPPMGETGVLVVGVGPFFASMGLAVAGARA